MICLGSAVFFVSFADISQIRQNQSTFPLLWQNTYITSRYVGDICKCKQNFLTLRNSFFHKLWLGLRIFPTTALHCSWLEGTQAELSQNLHLHCNGKLANDEMQNKLKLKACFEKKIEKLVATAKFKQAHMYISL